MDTITISCIARDGQVFLIEPPFVLSARPIIVNGGNYPGPFCRNGGCTTK